MNNASAFLSFHLTRHLFMKARHVRSKMYPLWEWPKSVEAGQWYERLALLNNVLCTHAFFNQ